MPTQDPADRSAQKTTDEKIKEAVNTPKAPPIATGRGVAQLGKDTAWQGLAVRKTPHFGGGFIFGGEMAA